MATRETHGTDAATAAARDATEEEEEEEGFFDRLPKELVYEIAFIDPETYVLLTRMKAGPLVFERTLASIMSDQASAGYTYPVPRVCLLLSSAVIRLGGDTTEGIFRVPASVSEIEALKEHLEAGSLDLSHVEDPQVVAATLKLWLRTLKDPLVPNDVYDAAVAIGGTDEETEVEFARAVDLIGTLPPENREVIQVIARLVKRLTRPECIEATRMTVDNLAMVFAPSFLRCPSDDLSVYMANADKEKVFVRRYLLGTLPHVAELDDADPLAGDADDAAGGDAAAAGGDAAAASGDAAGGEDVAVAAAEGEAPEEKEKKPPVPPKRKSKGLPARPPAVPPKDK